MSDPVDIDFDTLKPEEFENCLPELFASSTGKVSEDPRLKKLFVTYPDCLALVRDLETIAETARSLLEPEGEPSDKVWNNIQSKLREQSALDRDDGLDLDNEFEDGEPELE